MRRSKGPHVHDDSVTDSDGSTTKTDTDLDSDTETDSDKDFLPPSDSGPFSEEEKVLAYHSNRIYAAKVMKVEFHMKEWRYKVHYLGWNKSWDEWVGAERLMKYTEENVQKQKELQQKDKDKSTKPGRGTLVKPKTSGTRGKKRKNDSLTKEKGNMPFGKHMNIHIPLTLKKQLVDDCEFVTHLGKLVKLPRTPNVDDILKKYHDYRLKKDGLISDLVEELLRGLHSYFEKTLPVFLLYKSERQQYEEAIANNLSPSSVYGAEHFLRLFDIVRFGPREQVSPRVCTGLFLRTKGASAREGTLLVRSASCSSPTVKLPELLDNAQIEKETLMEMLPKLNDFLKFLQKNQSTFFQSTYNESTEASINKDD